MRQNEASLARLRRVHLGYVLQTGGLLPFLSVGDNARLPCRLNGQAGGRDRVEELLAILEIEKQARKKPQFLSGGQRQRAAIARALAHRPRWCWPTSPPRRWTSSPPPRFATSSSG